MVDRYVGCQVNPQPKPEKRKTINARKKRAAAAVIKAVRAQCVERDGACIFDEWQEYVGVCGGPSEWAHHYERRRSKTMGMEATYRHDRRFSFMACKKHHTAYDRHQFGVALFDTDGMDGVWGVKL